MGDSQAATGMNNASQTTVAQREESLRRVAVVLSSLPASTASQLLEKVDGYSRHVVQQAIATLHTVQPSERTGILQSFKERIAVRTPQTASAKASAPEGVPATQVADGVQDEILIGQSMSARVLSASPADRYGEQIATFFHENDASEDSSRSHFQFLDDVPLQETVTLLSGEHPQTIAVVLSSIPPKMAADILPQLDEAIQKQTLSRIGRLNDVPDETVAEVAQHLQSRYSEYAKETNDCSGKRALQAIMAEMPSKPAPVCEHVADRISDANQVSAAGEASAAYVAQPPVTEETRVPESPRLRIAEGTQDIQDEFALASDHTEMLEETPPEQTRPEEQSDVHDGDGVDLVDAAHQHLVKLPPQELVNALGRVETRDALLTLCGLPNQTAEAAIALLSRSKSRSVRRGIETLGPLQLREIDAAKQAVAMVSIGADPGYSLSSSRAA